ncbi:MAG TPA: CinA family protein [Candidatus Caccosoma faecigallinarum]|uniref:CinA family protein n=1 Tax=Candidatus Caccosoma faecigallinarum TaxID=2840720 RepID=A0A9D1K9S6_9FIRM|nr:competence/damage-inducible protein CinA [Firmicutes bacterium CAG:631]HIT17547.1 CinA family protein [Candidatus Caccosoma faecigallinarum]
MEELILKLKEKKLTIASCESLTGGLFAASLVSVSGASEVFVGGYVTYQNQAKAKILKGEEVLKKHGAISDEMACLMALTAQNDFGSDIAISFTGNAGPLADENKPVGLVYSCLLIKNKAYHFKNQYQGNRNEIRNQCLLDAKKRILDLL